MLGPLQPHRPSRRVADRELGTGALCEPVTRTVGSASSIPAGIAPAACRASWMLRCPPTGSAAWSALPRSSTLPTIPPPTSAAAIRVPLATCRARVQCRLRRYLPRSRLRDGVWMTASAAQLSTRLPGSGTSRPRRRRHRAPGGCARNGRDRDRVHPDYALAARIRARHDPMRAGCGEHRVREPVDPPPDAESDAAPQAGRRRNDDHQIAGEHADCDCEPHARGDSRHDQRDRRDPGDPVERERGRVERQRAEPEEREQPVHVRHDARPKPAAAPGGSAGRAPQGRLRSAARRR